MQIEIELKNGRWQTTDGLQFQELSVVEKKLFNVLIGFEKVKVKYNLIEQKQEQNTLDRLLFKIGINSKTLNNFNQNE